ncbi:MAG: transcriptional regulator [Campylobacterales bacterium]|nr:transcriptional regulator [Campylobacterales bacterium]
MKLLALNLLLTLPLLAVEVGTTPPTLTLQEERGGLVSDGSAWSSSSIKEKVYVMFYVDPDKKGVNEHYSAALKEKNYREKGAFGSIAIINLAATWKPNFVIESILESKQKEFPNTIYVKDKASVLVNEWELEDDASNILIFDKGGKLLFYKSGAMNEADILTSFRLIEENL